MQLSYTLIDLLDVLGFVQGVLLGTILLFNFRRGLAFPLLGLFLIGYSADFILSVLDNSGVLEEHPWLLFLPVRFNFLFMPALFLYAKSVVGQFKNRDFIHLLPGFIEFVAFNVLFLFPAAEKLYWVNEGTADQIVLLHVSLSIPIVLGYTAAIILLVRKHKKRVENYYSSTEGKTMQWVSHIAWFVLISVLFPLLDLFFALPETVIQLLSIINVVFLFG